MRRRNKLRPTVEVMSHAGNNCSGKAATVSKAPLHCNSPACSQRCSLSRQVPETCLGTTAACCPALTCCPGQTAARCWRSDYTTPLDVLSYTQELRHALQAHAVCCLGSSGHAAPLDAGLPLHALTEIDFGHPVSRCMQSGIACLSKKLSHP